MYQTRSRSRTWQTGITRYFNWKSLNANAGVNAFMRKDTGYDGTDKGMFLIFTLSHAGSSTGQLRSSSSAGASWQTSRRGSDQLSYNAAYSRYIDVSGESELGASLYGVNTDTMTSSAYGRAVISGVFAHKGVDACICVEAFPVEISRNARLPGAAARTGLIHLLPGYPCLTIPVIPVQVAAVDVAAFVIAERVAQRAIPF
ncbi:hypothetical protein EWM60_16730 [Candidatus Erwinia dacicola]|nr:hypothetical protein [Candidatus Erwinia dacicola]